MLEEQVSSSFKVLLIVLGVLLGKLDILADFLRGVGFVGGAVTGLAFSPLLDLVFYDYSQSYINT